MRNPDKDIEKINQDKERQENRRTENKYRRKKTGKAWKRKGKTKRRTRGRRKRYDALKQEKEENETRKLMTHEIIRRRRKGGENEPSKLT